MNERDFDVDFDIKKVVYTKADAIKLDTKFLYAGKLERIKKWNEKMHYHPFCEIVFVISGNGSVMVDGKEYAVKKGDIIVYNPGVPHFESTIGENGIELAFFGITNFKIGNLPFDCVLDDKVCPVIHSGIYADEYEFYFMSLIEETASDKPYNEIFSKYLARLILIGVLRLYNISEAKFVTNAIFTRIHTYLNKNFAKIESMDEICKELRISKYYISHVFKKYMGKPPMQYVTSKRISYAKKLLQETDLSATEIGEKCGYKDHVLFFKAFKKHEGITPIAYRKQMQKPQNALDNL
jgi:AraC-like DNA-binding protein/mannose-6-phosphate isomerase-like protein (cupin superfamily)